MIVIIHNEVFLAQPDQLTLHAIAAEALKGTHRILVEDDAAESFTAWLAALPALLQEQWEEVIKEGYRLESLEPARRTVLIKDVTTSDWTQPKPVLTPSDAHNLLRRPFNALLENANSDRKFLLRMASHEQRAYLLNFEQEGALIFENGGGITEMPKRVKAASEKGKIETMRLWLLFDSDALTPEKPSSHSNALRICCEEAGVSFYQLRRRNIENYIPKKALQGWAYNNPKKLKERNAVFKSFIRLSDVQRSHYNMKEGLAADARRDPPPDASVYETLNDADRRALSRGFDKHIAELFDGEAVVEDDLIADGIWSEMNPVITDLIALLR